MHFIAVEKRKYLFFFTSDSYVCFGAFQSGTFMCFHVVSCVGTRLISVTGSFLSSQLFLVPRILLVDHQLTSFLPSN